MRNAIAEFKDALKEAEKTLFSIGFNKFEFTEDWCISVRYRRDNIALQIIFGPPEYEILINTSYQLGYFQDVNLLQTPRVKNWIDSNRYTKRRGEDLKAELLWEIDLFEFAISDI